MQGARIMKIGDLVLLEHDIPALVTSGPCRGVPDHPRVKVSSLLTGISSEPWLEDVKYLGTFAQLCASGFGVGAWIAERR